MPVYFGHPRPVVRGGRQPTISAALQRLGIEMLRAAPGEVVVDVVVYAPWLPFVMLLSLLSAVVYSIASKQKVSGNREGYALPESTAEPFLVPEMQLCLRVTNPNTTAREWLDKESFIETEIRQKVYHICDNVSIKALRELANGTANVSFEEKCFAPSGSMNFAAACDLKEIVHLIGLTVRALSKYSQFETEEAWIDRENTSYSFLDTLTETLVEGSPSKKSKTTTRGTVDPVSGCYIKEKNASSLLMKRNYVEVDGANMLAGSWWTPSGIADMKCPGILVRFVEDLAKPDTKTVPDFISRNLIKNLGDSPIEQMARMADLRSSWGLIATTASGHILTHMIRCIELAIQTHTAACPMFDSVLYYEGCVLVGSNFSLSINQRIFNPLSAENLKADLDAMMTHEKVLKLILAKLPTVMGEENELPTYMSALRERTLKAAISEEDKDYVTEMAYQLRFPDKRWSINAGSISNFCKLLSGDDEIVSRTPLGPQALFSNDIVVCALSCFRTGQYPSFRHSAGTPISLESKSIPRPSVAKLQPGKKGKQSMSNAGWIMTIRRVEYDEALGDFRAVQSEKTIRSVSSSTARQLGLFIASGEKFLTLFSQLRQAVNAAPLDSTGVKRLHDSGSGSGSAIDTTMAPSAGKRRKIFG